ncbi:hypothetical protein HW132_16565 [Brasilonema sp. CT11]|nr:hypothetical protein [Brasilonema sp. CT11]
MLKQSLMPLALLNTKDWSIAVVKSLLNTMSEAWVEIQKFVSLELVHRFHFNKV